MQKTGKNRISYILPAGIFGLLLALLIPFILGYYEQHPMQYFESVSFPENTSACSVLSGEFQDGFGKWMRNSFLGRTAGERLKNQIVYSVFRDSSEGFSQGEGGYLFYNEFLENHIGVPDSISVSSVVTDYDQYAKELKELQEHLNNEGKDFILIINPNKFKVYPDKLPWYQRILLGAAFPEESSGTKLVRALDENGVNYYETAEDLKGMRADDQFSVFCNTGFHWTLTACAYEIQQVIRHINEGSSFRKYNGINVVGMVNELYETDKDIINAFELPFSYKEDRYVKPVIEYTCNDAEVFLFGTSFGHQITDVLYRSNTEKAFEKLTFMMYFTGKFVFDSEGETQLSFPEGTDYRETGIYQSIKESDLVILEHQYWVPAAQLKFVQYINSCYSTGGAEECHL